MIIPIIDTLLNSEISDQQRVDDINNFTEQTSIFSSPGTIKPSQSIALSNNVLRRKKNIAHSLDISEAK